MRLAAFDRMPHIAVKLGIAGALALLAMAQPAAAQKVSVRERTADVTEATVVLDATPTQVYELATNYRLWPVLFSDIRSVKVEGGTREHAKVRFRSQAFDREITVRFDNVPGRSIRFVALSGAPGGKARGEYTLTPLDGGRRTQVTARLYVKIVGPAKMFVSTAETRSMRQRKLRSDLTDTQRWIARNSRPSQSFSATRGG